MSCTVAPENLSSRKIQDCRMISEGSYKVDCEVGSQAMRSKPGFGSLFLGQCPLGIRDRSEKEAKTVQCSASNARSSSLRSPTCAMETWCRASFDGYAAFFGEMQLPVLSLNMTRFTDDPQIFLPTPRGNVVAIPQVPDTSEPNQVGCTCNGCFGCCSWLCCSGFQIDE